jgi:hypothetical protein
VTRMNDSALAIRLRAWTQADLGLLQQANTPEMTEHLGGPETEDQLLDRHHRYLKLKDPGAGQMLAVILPDGQPAGIIGYWERPGCTSRSTRQAGTYCPASTDAASRQPPPERSPHSPGPIAGTLTCTPSRPRTTPPPTRSAARPASRCSAKPTSSIRPAVTCGATTGGWNSDQNDPGRSPSAFPEPAPSCGHLSDPGSREPLRPAGRLAPQHG